MRAILLGVLLAFGATCTKGSSVNSPTPSNDYISETRRALLYAPVEKFRRVPIDLTDQAVSMLEDVMILAPAWRPSAETQREFALGHHTLLFRVRYASPGGPLELRSEGTAVIHVVERPEPVTPAVVVQLAQAMFGESKQRGDLEKQESSQLAFQPPDAEGIRFSTWIAPGVPKPGPRWPNHRTGFFGVVIPAHRNVIELLYNYPRNQ